MSSFKLLNFNSIGFSNSHQILGSKNILKIYQGQQACISGKIFEKLNIPKPPKRPVTPYIRFVMSIKDQVTRENPHLLYRDLFKKISEGWKTVAEEEKKVLQEQYNQEISRYKESMKEYKQSITPEQQELIKQSTEDKKLQKKKAEIAKKRKELGRPKKPLTPFLKYLLENKSSWDSNKISYSDWMVDIGKKWKSVSEDVKSSMQLEFQKEQKQYKTELLAWEENMIRQGHGEVIRNQDRLVTVSKKKLTKS